MTKKSKNTLNDIVLEEILKTSLIEQQKIKPLDTYLPKYQYEPAPSDYLGSGGDFERQQRAMYPMKPFKKPKIKPHEKYHQYSMESKDAYFDRMYGTNPVVKKLLQPKGTGSEYDHANKTLQILQNKKIPIRIFLSWARSQWDSNLTTGAFDGKYMIIDKSAPHLMGKISWQKFFKALANYDVKSNDPTKFGNALKDFTVGIQILSYGQSNLGSALYLIRRNQNNRTSEAGYMYFTFSYNNPSKASPGLSVSFKLRGDKLWLSSADKVYGFLTKKSYPRDPFKTFNEKMFAFSKYGPGGQGAQYYDQWKSNSGGWDLAGLHSPGSSRDGSFIRFYPKADPEWEIGQFDKDAKAIAQNPEWYDHIYKITPELKKQYPELDQSDLDKLLAFGDWGGFLYPPVDIAMAAVYFGLGRPIEGTISLIGAIPVFGDAVQVLYKGGKRLINGTKALKAMQKTSDIADIQRRMNKAYKNLDELKKLDRNKVIDPKEYENAINILNDLEEAIKKAKGVDHTAGEAAALILKKSRFYANSPAGREAFNNIILRSFSSPAQVATLIKTERKAAKNWKAWIATFGKGTLDIATAGTTIIVRKAIKSITKYGTEIVKYSRLEAVRGLKIAETRFLKLATNDSTFTAIAMHGFTGGTKTKIFKRAGDDIFKNKEFRSLLKKKYGIKGKMPREALDKRLLEDTDEIMKLWKSNDPNGYKLFINDNTDGLTGLLSRGGQGYLDGTNHFFTAFANQSLYKMAGFAAPPGIWKNTGDWKKWSNFMLPGGRQGVMPIIQYDLFKDAGPLIYNEMVELVAALKGDENLSEQSVMIAFLDNVLMYITNDLAGYKFVGYRGLLEEVRNIKKQLAPIGQIADNQKETNAVGLIDWDDDVPITHQEFLQTYKLYWSQSVPYHPEDEDAFKKLKKENPKAYEASMLLKLNILESWAERGWITPMADSYSRATGLAERWIVSTNKLYQRYGLRVNDEIDFRKWTPGGIGDSDYNAIYNRLKEQGKFKNVGLLQPKKK